MKISVAICLLFFGLCLYSYLDMQNAVTKLRIEVPKIARSVKAAQEENVRLKYSIEAFENPQHLMQLAKASEFSHLKFPLVKEIVTVKSGLALANPAHSKNDLLTAHPHIALASRQP